MLKSIRRSAKMRQVELAKKVGVSQSTIAMWETGKSQPRADKLIKLANILGCTVDDLIRDQEASDEKH